MSNLSGFDEFISEERKPWKAYIMCVNLKYYSVIWIQQKKLIKKNEWSYKNWLNKDIWITWMIEETACNLSIFNLLIKNCWSFSSVK